MILSLRLIADYLWQYKEVSVGVAVLASLQVVILLFIRPINRLMLTSALVFVLLLVVSIRDPENYDSTTLTVLLKLATLPVLLLAGSLSDVRRPLSGWLTLVSSLLLIPILVSLFTGSGFLQWGAARTFAGGFFFKTDLAYFLTSAVIYFLAARNRLTDWVVAPAILMLAGLVFLSNARIYYLIFPLIVLSIWFQVYRRFKTDVFVGLILVSGLVFVSGVYFVAEVLRLDNMLLFDLNETLYSERNTQGRSVIWASVWGHYISDLTVLQKLIGEGLGADGDFISHSLSEKHSELRDCHNIYLYILVNHGIVGLGLFLTFLVSWFRRFVWLSSQQLDAVAEETLCCSFAFGLVFCLAGLTNNVIVYAQSAWPFFFFAGRIFALSGARIGMIVESRDSEDREWPDDVRPLEVARDRDLVHGSALLGVEQVEFCAD
ncbi:MAG: O-antigen ligase family protein [Planctomycetaceae bacterium]|nr:O-antigen ligase family protein [Planctomycetaceae bacterium]